MNTNKTRASKAEKAAKAAAKKIRQDKNRASRIPKKPEVKPEVTTEVTAEVTAEVTTEVTKPEVTKPEVTTRVTNAVLAALDPRFAAHLQPIAGGAWVPGALTKKVAPTHPLPPPPAEEAEANEVTAEEAEAIRAAAERAEARRRAAEKADAARAKAREGGAFIEVKGGLKAPSAATSRSNAKGAKNGIPAKDSPYAPLPLNRAVTLTGSGSKKTSKYHARREKEKANKAREKGGKTETAQEKPKTPKRVCFAPQEEGATKAKTAEENAKTAEIAVKNILQMTWYGFDPDIYEFEELDTYGFDPATCGFNPALWPILSKPCNTELEQELEQNTPATPATPAAELTPVELGCSLAVTLFSPKDVDLKDQAEILTKLKLITRNAACETFSDTSWDCAEMDVQGIADSTKLDLLLTARVSGMDASQAPFIKLRNEVKNKVQGYVAQNCGGWFLKSCVVTH